jgi:hypothetical protein
VTSLSTAAPSILSSPGDARSTGAARWAAPAQSQPDLRSRTKSQVSIASMIARAVGYP